MNFKKFEHRLFGRTRGRSKKKINIKSYLNLTEKFIIKKLKNNEEYILDIGSGYGETSTYLSNKFPNKLIISCEKYIDGNLNLYRNIESLKLKNLRVYPGNVNNILDQNIKSQYFSLVFIFFPDPWPKRRHWKRRLINVEFLKKIHTYLKKGAEIHIATDSISYSRQIFQVLFETKNLYKFINQNEIYLGIKDYYNIETKYYKKAINSQRKPSLFVLRKL